MKHFIAISTLTLVVIMGCSEDRATPADPAAEDAGVASPESRGPLPADQSPTMPDEYASAIPQKSLKQTGKEDPVHSAKPAHTAQAQAFPGLHPSLISLANRFGRDRVALVVVENPPNTSTQELMSQLRHVAPQAQVIMAMPAAVAHEKHIAIAQIDDLQAFANKIPFGALEQVDAHQRVITIEY